ncbi:DUF2283 domain-containing protein [Candidatus Woesearchaeota archaeon]|nr:DUF2283 domain-containing protein [Candidatus Woesearchaeota archaeon]
MKIRYDSEADALYIRINDGAAASTKEVDKNTIIDFDSSGQVVGVELLFVKERNPSLLKELKVENLISA